LRERSALSEGFIKRAPDTEDILLCHVGVDHGGLKILVAEQLLNRPDVVPGFQKMGGKAVPPMPNSA
jgi:hypothetical protein